MRCTFRFLQKHFIALVTVFLAIASSQAQVASRITQSITGSPKVTLANSTPAVLRGATDLGSVDSSTVFQKMVLVLQPSDQQKKDMAALVAAQNDSNSAQYHQWLQPADFAARFAPTPSDIAQIRAWLEGQGFTVDEVSKSGFWIQFSGTASQVSSTFQTTIHRYRIDGQERISNASDISLPSALTSVVAGVASLNNIPRKPLHTHLQHIAATNDHKLVAVTTSNGGSSATSPDYTAGSGAHYLSPGDMATIYDTQPLLASNDNGAGISIAVIGQTDVQLADIETFRSIFGLPASDPQVVVVGPDPGISSGDEVESDLDLEYAGALAPGAQIIFVEAGSTYTTAGIDLAAAYAVDNRLAPILTLSYGGCEAILGPAANQFYNLLWEQAAAEGITVFVSAGDSGSAGCSPASQGYPAGTGFGVNGLASTPYAVAVGGTEFIESSASGVNFWNKTDSATYSSAIGYIPETVWNESCDKLVDPAGCAADGGYTVLYAGSGGKSKLYAKPSWQAGTGVLNDGSRDIPDVSLAGAGKHDGYIICNEGSCQTAYQNGVKVIVNASVVGGTSASAPSMAGIMALLEQKNGAYQGQANVMFYRLAANQTASACNSSDQTSPTTPTTCIFHDITVGTNSVPCIALTNDCSSAVTNVDGVINGYSSTVGYDLTTGLGSLDAANLVAAWQSNTRLSSATTLQSSQSSLVHGTPFTFQVNVSPSSGSGTPGGDVSLLGGSQSVGPFTLASGSYSGKTSALPGGTYGLTAHYAGDGTYQSSDSSALNVTVSPEASTVSLSATYYSVASAKLLAINGPLSYGAYLYVTVKVTGKSGQGEPSGQITILLDGKTVATVPADSTGQANVFLQNYLDSNGILPGSHTLSAAYGGDASFQSSALTSPFTFSVSKGYVYTFAIPNVATAVVGQPIQITASLFGASGNASPTGTIQLYDNGTALGPVVTLGSSSGEYTATSLAVGTHKLTTVYSGDVNYAATAAGSYYQNSNTLTITNSALTPTATTVTPSATTISAGQSVTYTISVANAGNGTALPTGTVTLTNAQVSAAYPTINFVSAVTLVNGTYKVTLPLYRASTLELFATYSGDKNYAASVSKVIRTVIQTIAPTATLTANSPYALPNTQSTLRFTVVGAPNNANYAVPTGTVKYYDSLNGATAQLIGYDAVSLGNGEVGVDSFATVLSTGNHLLTAVYSGDTTWSGVQAQTSVFVTSPDFAVTPSAGTNVLSVGGSAQSTLTVTPLLDYSGTVSLTCSSGVPIGVSCAIAPSSVSLGSAVTTTVTLTSAAAHAELLVPPFLHKDRTEEAGILFAGLGIAGLCCLRRRSTVPAILGAFLLTASLGFWLTGCGSPAVSAYTVTLTSQNGAKAVQGSSVQLQALIAGNVGGTVNGGSVTFYDGSASLGTGTVSNGVANLTTSSLAVGIHTLTAVYLDTQAVSATSNTVNQAMTGSFTVQVAASSGSLTHSTPLSFQLQ